MTVEANDPFVEYNYLGPASFPFIFKVQEDDDLVITHIDGTTGTTSILVLGDDYTVTINPGPNDGGSAAVSYSGTVGTLELSRSIPPTQEVDWVNNTPFDMEILEDAVDKLTLLVQQLIWSFSQEGEIPLSELGDLLTHNGIGLDKLPLGLLDQILAADPNGALGIKWVNAAPSGLSPLTTKGDLYGFALDNTRVAVGADGTVLSGDSSNSNGVSYKKLAELPWDPDDPGNLPGGASPLTTKGDIYSYSSTNDRFPVGADSWVMVPDVASITGLKWIKLKDILLDPDDPGAGFPGAGTGTGDGIATPLNPPVRVNDLVTYADTAGTQGGDSPTEFLVGDMRGYTDATGVLHVETIAGGAAAVILHAGAAALELNVTAAEASVKAVGVPLELISDTPFPTNGDGRPNAVSIDGFRMPPGVDAVPGTSVQVSNTLDTDGNPSVGVFDVNSASNPGGVFGSTVTGV